MLQLKKNKIKQEQQVWIEAGVNWFEKLELGFIKRLIELISKLRIKDTF